MAKKTVVKKVLKYAPMSTEIAAQVQTDESVKSFDKTNTDLMSDMASLPNETIIEGEIIEDESAEAGADSGNANE
jgi:recombination protein RecT